MRRVTASQFDRFSYRGTQEDGFHRIHRKSVGAALPMEPRDWRFLHISCSESTKHCSAPDRAVTSAGGMTSLVQVMSDVISWAAE